MHKLYDLKEMLCKELEEYGSNELNVGDLEIVDKLAHAIKNIDKIIMADKYSGYYDGYNDDYGANYRDNYRDYRDDYRDNYGDGGYSARGRGRNARRDSRGRYMDSYGNDMVNELRQMMNNAPDQKTRMEFEKLINKMEQM